MDQAYHDYFIRAHIIIIMISLSVKFFLEKLDK